MLINLEYSETLSEYLDSRKCIIVHTKPRVLSQTFDVKSPVWIRIKYWYTRHQAMSRPFAPDSSLCVRQRLYGNLYRRISFSHPLFPK